VLAVQYSANAVYCSVEQSVAVLCSVLQCVAMCCSVLQCVAGLMILQYNAVCSSDCMGKWTKIDPAAGVHKVNFASRGPTHRVRESSVLRV